MKKIIGLMGLLVLFAATADIANAKRKTSTHPATTAGAPQAASPQGGASPQDGTAATPTGTAAQPGATVPGMAAPQGVMSQPGAAAPAGIVGGAPVGHRQPRAGDIPPQDRNPNDPMTKEDEALDKKIKSICRGC